MKALLESELGQDPGPLNPLGVNQVRLPEPTTYLHDKTRVVRLPQPVEVVMQYWTASGLAAATPPQTRAGNCGYYFWLFRDGSFWGSGHVRE